MGKLDLVIRDLGLHVVEVLRLDPGFLVFSEDSFRVVFIYFVYFFLENDAVELCPAVPG